MALRRLFGGKPEFDEEKLTIDDLVTLERYDEAEEKLRQRLKLYAADLHSRLKLADVLMRVGRRVEAVDEYLLVAEGYGRDGFYDKANALLAKLARYLPDNEKIRAKMTALERAKRQERRREVVVDSLLSGRRSRGVAGGRSAVELQQVWHNLAESVLLEHLSDAQLRRLFGAVRMVILRAGERLVEAGAERGEIYILGRGEIEARVDLESGETTALRAFGPGEIVGDRCLLEHQPWPADYYAATEVTALALDREGLEQALTGEPDPKGFLDLLRSQRNDKAVTDVLRRVRAGH